MARSNECATKGVPILNFFFDEKAFGKKSRPKITSSQRKSLNANEKLIAVVWSNIKKIARSNECATTGVLILDFFSMKKPSAKNLAPKLHQVSEKALMPPKKLITVVWSSIKRW